MDKQFRDLCTSGAFSILSIEMDELLKTFEVEYCENPYRLSYEHGKLEGAEQFCQDLKDLIESYARKS